ncbi:hypothetical protein IE81DRAFT_172027 [Ceraceosorus guamensis]|uniref:Uncharacterized protein n=1 Tax=Ceraceosorus guamensis TaxID=1522189 RepID=A0A316VVU7_9BASI|nr:hypothetical protein IE81DRAFT_172027 [Ceraceosorus guamensis]PWN41572.1 hypothetical protein IE81DRAFT_172027 [Ceraceosorus guamensis]
MRTCMYRYRLSTWNHNAVQQALPHNTLTHTRDSRLATHHSPLTTLNVPIPIERRGDPSARNHSDTALVIFSIKFFARSLLRRLGRPVDGFGGLARGQLSVHDAETTGVRDVECACASASLCAVVVVVRATVTGSGWPST